MQPMVCSAVLFLFDWFCQAPRRVDCTVIFVMMTMGDEKGDLDDSVRMQLKVSQVMIHDFSVLCF